MRALSKERMIEALLDDQINMVANDILVTVLSDPEVFEVVTKKAMALYHDFDLKTLHNNGVNQLSDLAYHYLWNRIQE